VAASLSCAFFTDRAELSRLLEQDESIKVIKIMKFNNRIK
jgi:hypothetical protein